MKMKKRGRGAFLNVHTNDHHERFPANDYNSGPPPRQSRFDSQFHPNNPQAGPFRGNLAARLGSFSNQPNHGSWNEGYSPEMNRLQVMPLNSDHLRPTFLNGYQIPGINPHTPRPDFSDPRYHNNTLYENVTHPKRAYFTKSKTYIPDDDEYDDMPIQQQTRNLKKLPQPSLDLFVQGLLDSFGDDDDEMEERPQSLEERLSECFPSTDIPDTPMSPTDFASTLVKYQTAFMDESNFASACEPPSNPHMQKGKSLVQKKHTAVDIPLENPVKREKTSPVGIKLDSNSNLAMALEELRKKKQSASEDKSSKKASKDTSMVDMVKSIWNGGASDKGSSPATTSTTTSRKRSPREDSSEAKRQRRTTVLEGTHSSRRSRSPEWKRKVRIVDNKDRTDAGESRRVRRERTKSRSRSPSSSSRRRYFRYSRSPSSRSNSSHSTQRSIRSPPRRRRSPTYSPPPRFRRERSQDRPHSHRRRSRSRSTSPPRRSVFDRIELSRKRSRSRSPPSRVQSNPPLPPPPPAAVQFTVPPPSIIPPNHQMLAAYNHQLALQTQHQMAIQQYKQQVVSAMMQGPPPPFLPVPPPHPASYQPVAHVVPAPAEPTSPATPTQDEMDADAESKKIRSLRDEHMDNQNKLIHELRKLHAQQEELWKKQRVAKAAREIKRLETLIVDNAKLQKEVVTSVHNLEKIILKHTAQLKEDLEQVCQSRPSPKTPNYRFFDPGHHWCSRCDFIGYQVQDYVLHLHSKQHMDRLAEEGLATPWRDRDQSAAVHEDPESGAPLLAPFHGLQCLQPVNAWYCDVCHEWLGDVPVVQAHLSSGRHNQRYVKWMMDRPDWEVSYAVGKQKAIRRKAERERKASEAKEKEEEARKRAVEQEQKKKWDSFVQHEKSIAVPVEELEESQRPPEASGSGSKSSAIRLNICTKSTVVNVKDLTTDPVKDLEENQRPPEASGSIKSPAIRLNIRQKSAVVNVKDLTTNPVKDLDPPEASGSNKPSPSRLNTRQKSAVVNNKDLTTDPVKELATDPVKDLEENQRPPETSGSNKSSPIRLNFFQKSTVSVEDLPTDPVKEPEENLTTTLVASRIIDNVPTIPESTEDHSQQSPTNEKDPPPQPVATDSPMSPVVGDPLAEPSMITTQTNPTVVEDSEFTEDTFVLELSFGHDDEEEATSNIIIPPAPPAPPVIARVKMEVSDSPATTKVADATSEDDDSCMIVDVVTPVPKVVACIDIVEDQPEAGGKENLGADPLEDQVDNTIVSKVDVLKSEPVEEVDGSLKTAVKSEKLSDHHKLSDHKTCIDESAAVKIEGTGHVKSEVSVELGDFIVLSETGEDASCSSPAASTPDSGPLIMTNDVTPEFIDLSD